MHHRRRTGPADRARALKAALGVLLACAALGGSALAAAGGAPTDPAAAVVQIARQQLGDPYAWGATGPDSWDCSGLTSRLWREVGGVPSIPRVARDQQAWAVPIPAEQLLVGDLVFFGNPVSHVALYAGDGKIVDASSSQHGVVERSLWKQSVIRYGRVPRPGMPAVTPWKPSVLPSPTPSPSSGSSGTTGPAASPGTTAGTAGPTPVATSTRPLTPPTRTTPPRAGKPPIPAPVAPPAVAPPAVAPPSVAPPSVAPSSAAPAALTTAPLRGLPIRDLPALTSVPAGAIRNAQSVRGSRAWTDVELVRAAWRHAGGGTLPATRPALVAAGSPIPIGAARIGDVVVYGDPAGHVGIYLGHGYMVDASPSLARVVVRRVYASPTVRIVRLPVS